MTISFVASDTWTDTNTWYEGGAGTNPITITAPSTTVDDYLIAYGSQNVDASVTDLASNGWTVIREQSQAGNSHFVAYRRLTGSPAASYDFTTSTSSSGNDAFVSIAAYRGVSTTNPFDITFAEADHYSNYETLSTTHDAPDATTRAVNSWILSIIFTRITTGGATTWTPPSGFVTPNDEEGGSANAHGGAIAHKVETAPVSRTIGTWATSLSTRASLYTLVLRDAASTYIEISNVTWDPPTGFGYVEYRDDVIPENSILHLHQGTHTGSNNTSTLTDSAKTTTADEWKDYRIRNFSDGSSGIIGTHSAGTGPYTLSTALSGGNGDDFDTGDSYDIEVPMEDGDQIEYETSVTSGFGTADFKYHLVDASDGSVTAEQTATIQASGLPSGSAGTIDVTNSGVPLFNITSTGAGGSNMSAIFGHNIPGESIFGDIITSTASTPTAALTGTITSSTVEADIVSGGKTIILTLTDDTWVASGSTFDAQRQNIIDGLDAATSPTNGWNNEVRDKMSVSEVVRTSDTVVTITLLAQSGYDISAQETVTATIPASALVGSASPIVASPTFTVDYTASAILSGTVTLSINEQDIVDGGKNIVLTTVDDTWVTAGATFDAQRQNIIDGITSGQSETTGWNNEVRDNMLVGAVVRTNDTTVTVTLAAAGAYDITSLEFIVATIPATALTGGVEIVASPGFIIAAEETGGAGGIAPAILQRNIRIAQQRRRNKKKKKPKESLESVISRSLSKKL